MGQPDSDAREVEDDESIFGEVTDDEVRYPAWMERNPDTGEVPE